MKGKKSIVQSNKYLQRLKRKMLMKVFNDAYIFKKCEQKFFCHDSFLFNIYILLMLTKSKN